MGKRGFKPKGPYENQSAMLSARIRPETKRVLEEIAKKADRSLSQEIEHRLRQSFDRDREISELFGDVQIFAVVRAVAIAMALVDNAAPGRRKDWREDTYAFDQMVIAVNAILRAFRPPKVQSPASSAAATIDVPAAEPDQLEKAAAVWHQKQGAMRAEEILKAIKNADPKLPVPPKYRQDLAARLGLRKQINHIPYIREDLGSLIDRIPDQGGVEREIASEEYQLLIGDFFERIASDKSLPDEVREAYRKRIKRTKQPGFRLREMRALSAAFRASPRIGEKR